VGSLSSAAHRSASSSSERSPGMRGGGVVGAAARAVHGRAEPWHKVVASVVADGDREKEERTRCNADREREDQSR
jgi:hypothetical protein